MKHNPEFRSITAIFREQIGNAYQLKRGWRFTDQSGNVLRKLATRPYTHASIQSTPVFEVIKGGEKIQHVFLCFHSTPNPKPTYRTYSIERVIPIQERTDKC